MGADVTYRRGWIALLIFTVVIINYIDRIALSVAAKPIVAEYGFSPVQMGTFTASVTRFMTSAFSCGTGSSSHIGLVCSMALAILITSLTEYFQ